MRVQLEALGRTIVGTYVGYLPDNMERRDCIRFLIADETTGQLEEVYRPHVSSFKVLPDLQLVGIHDMLVGIAENISLLEASAT